jgi:hypothetical protein
MTIDQDALEAAAKAIYDGWHGLAGRSRTSRHLPWEAAPEATRQGFRLDARAAVTAYLAALQETHALVPREATVGMFRALTNSWHSKEEAVTWSLGTFAEDYRAMIDAAPPAAQEKK